MAEEVKRKRGRPRKIQPGDMQERVAQTPGTTGKKAIALAKSQTGMRLKGSTPEDSSLVINHCGRVSGIAEPHPEDSPQAMEKRIAFLRYVEDCMECDLPVTNFGAYAALRITKWDFEQTKAGRRDKDLMDLYQEITTFLAMYLEIQTGRGRINPATAIFTQKNFYGMRDEQELIVASRDRFGETPDGAKLAAKYADLPD